MLVRKLILIFLLIISLMISGFSFNLPDIEIPEASVVYDINNRPIKGLSEYNRISVNIDEISPNFIKAVVAVEDKDFYSHHGIDFTGILRALYVNVKNLKVVEGGSTITQQTAKTLFLSNERTLIRKIKELFYAIELERNYSKDEIITLYCNTIFFGEGAYGIEVAARTFFAKSAIDLSIAEAALLAGLPQWPSNYNPYKNPGLAKKRQGIVLQSMVTAGFITEEEKVIAQKEELIYHRSAYISGEAPYFIALVKEYLTKKYGERLVYQGGLKIYTTLDLDMQKAANQSITEGLKNYSDELQTALVAIDARNGEIRSLVGGRSFRKSNYNRVFSLRQPGSTFKPLMYSLAIEAGFTSADMITCDEVKFELPNGDIYMPTDYGEEPYHWQDFTLKEALMKSDNVIAVKLNDWLNPKATALHGEKFGLSGLQPILSLPLGSIEASPLQMAAAYAVFANGGIYSEPYYILKIMDKQGKTLEENQIKQRIVVSPENAYIITNMLQGVLEPGGTGAGLRTIVSSNLAGKTGTTDEFKDAWFIGYSPSLSCAVWIGNDTGESTNLVGSVVAGPIWANYFKSINSKLNDSNFTKPSNVEVVNICLESGLIATESCPRTSEMAFIKGSEPTNICYYHYPIHKWLYNIRKH